jgi:hypothetical protein
MEIQKALAFNGISTAHYAVLFQDGEFRIRTTPYPVLPWRDTISLKDVKYKVLEGTLYIQGTRIYYYNFENLLTLIDTWGPRSLFKITYKRDKPGEDLYNNNDKLVEPFVEQDLVIHRWWWKNKIIKGVDLTNKEVLNWYLSKVEEPYEVAISNFIVREDL